MIHKDNTNDGTKPMAITKSAFHTRYITSLNVGSFSLGYLCPQKTERKIPKEVP
jgi:hypothetical protein